MIQKFRRRIAISLLPAALFTLKPTEAKSNPAIVAPAVCVGSAGVGCVFVGVAVVGGISYHVWQNTQTGAQYRVPSVPTPQPMPSRVFMSENYNIPGVREVHWASDESGCARMAQRFRNEGRRLDFRRFVRDRRGKSGLCIFEGPDAMANYYNDRRY